MPQEITTQNVVTIIKAQNPEIQNNGEDIEAKYKFKDRKGRHNIVMEVGPRIRQQILQIKLKIGWAICNVLATTWLQYGAISVTDTITNIMNVREKKRVLTVQENTK